jgi:hypothetical protein
MINAMPFTATPQLQFSERYIENSDTRTNLRSEDYISSAVASLQLEYRFPASHLSGGVSYESSYSSSNNTDRSNRLNGALDYLYEARRWSSGLKGSAVSTQYGETASQLNEGVLTHSTDFRQESAGVYGKYLLSRQWDLSMNYDYIKNQYSSAQYVDFESHSAASSLVYLRTLSDQLELLGGANYYRFYPGANIKSVTANARWKHQAGKFTVIQAGTGVGVTTGRRAFWLFDLNLTRNFERGSVSAGYSRNIGSGGGIAGTATITQQVTLSASKTLWQDLSGNISVSYGSSIATIPGTNYDAKFWNAGGGLNFGILKWLNGSLSLSHSYQETEGRLAESLTSDQVSFTLSTHFSPWRLF